MEARRAGLLEIPYSQTVALSEGSSVIIRGKANNAFRNDPQMQVDFYTEVRQNPVIAFSLRVHFGKFVTMSSFQSDGWGLEKTSYHMPFVDGEEFEVQIKVLQSQYQISVNGQYQDQIPTRIHPESVTEIQVWRDVFLSSLIIA